MTRLFVLFTTLSLAVSAQAQSYGFTSVGAVEASPELQGLWGKTLHGDVGVEAFAYLSPGWSEAYVGPTWTPTEGLTLGVSGGVELVGGAFEPRFAGSVLWSSGKFLTIGVAEWGVGSGVWYRVVSIYSLKEWVKVGLEARRFVGVGPRIEVSIPKTPVTLSVVWTPIEIEGFLVHPGRTVFTAAIGF